MFKKLNTTTLVIILLVLGGLAALNKFYFSKKSESTFETSFVQIDTADVTQVLIYPKAAQGKEIKLTKTEKGWELQSEKTKTMADTAEVHRLLANFADVHSTSLAAQDKSGWADYQVNDSLGSRIKFIAGRETYEMVVGKFGFNPAARNGVTYIRHVGDEKVYAVEGYISFSVNRDFTSWRMKTLMAGNKDNWTQLSFSYPGDSSFTLVKQNNQWMLNGQPVDSIKTDQYLTQLANKQSTGFEDGYIPNTSAVYTLSVSGHNQSKAIMVQAFPADSTQRFILHSSLNPDAYFSEAKNPITESIFVGRSHFLNQ